MKLGRYSNYDPKRKRQRYPFMSLTDDERLRHVWILGKSGTGKSTFLGNLAAQDFDNGFTLIDPHGDLARELLDHIPPEHVNKTIYFDVADTQHPIGFNPLQPTDNNSLLASMLMDAFSHIWDIGPHTPQLEQILFNAIAAVLEKPNPTFLTLWQFLNTKKHAAKDPVIEQFWREYDSWPQKDKHERTLSTKNKIGQLLSDTTLRHILCQKSPIDFHRILANQEILIVNLNQARLGFRKAALLGTLLITQLHHAALQRQDRTLYPLYCDEFHSFGSTAFVEMLSGIRKFGVAMTLSHQYVDQLTPEMQRALVGTVGTTVAFKLGAFDTKLVQISDYDLANTATYEAVVRTPRDFQQIFTEPIQAKRYGKSDAIINRSRWLAANRDALADKLLRFLETG